MGTKYNAEKLQSLIEDFSNVTGIVIEVLDSDFNSMAGVVSNNDFCSALQSMNVGLNRCICSDKELLKMCKISNKAERHICHAGLVDIVAPIVKNNNTLGYVLLGRIRNTADFENIYQNIMWSEKDYDVLKKYFLKLICYNEIQIKGIMSIAVAITSLILSENVISEQYNKPTEDIVAFIEENIDKRLSVAILCDKMNISKNTLYEHFRYTFECTVAEYISKRRIEKAKKLLSETELSIAEIAERCGIENYTYLFKLMKKYENMTPNQYRNKYNGGRIYSWTPRSK